jgi:hypothetical protein
VGNYRRGMLNEGDKVEGIWLMDFIHSNEIDNRNIFQLLKVGGKESDREAVEVI